MQWNDNAISTWYANVPLDSDGNIISAESQATEVKLKTISVKGQNSSTTVEPDDYGFIGNAFIDIFNIRSFDNVYRRAEENLEEE